MKEDVQLDEMHERLRQLYAENKEARPVESIQRLIEDPLKPHGDNGRFRVNPALALLGGLATLAVAAFLYFSFGV